MYYFEPVNLNQWNMFEKVSGVGHVEPFLGTKAMTVGDVVLLHVGAQNKNVESGIYAYGTVIEGPLILRDHPEDYCNNKTTVMVRIEKIVYQVPIISHIQCKQYINQFRTVHLIAPQHYSALKKELGL